MADSELTQEPEVIGRFGLWLSVAVAIFLVALGIATRGFLGAEFSRDVPIPARALEDKRGDPKPLGGLRSADYRVAAWTVARNAHALLHQPLHLFDAESCFPQDRSLALHHPILAPAVVALPVYLATGDPISTFNAALLLGVLLSFLAMYWLVLDWTKMPAAAIAAGVLFAFHPSRLVAPYHFFTTDNAWLLFGLLLARRLVAHGRWRDGIGLGVVGSLQLASSSYPLYAAALTAIPFAGWLAWRSDLRRIRWGPVAVAIAPMILTSIVVLGPYLEMRGAELQGRPQQYFASWSWLLPTGKLFPGFATIAMLVSAFALPSARQLGQRIGDPRFVLGFAMLLLMLVAADGNRPTLAEALAEGPETGFELPRFYTMLASVVPGLDVIRLPSAIAHGALLLACVLAGLGCAGLIRSVPERLRGWMGAGLIAIVFVETLFVGAGKARPVHFESLSLRPPQEQIALFEELEALGNRGPILEVPILWGSPVFRTASAPAQVLLSAYHHRRTSGCYASFIPAAVRNHEALSNGLLMSQDGVQHVREAGFTTVVVRHPGASGRQYLEALNRVAADSEGALSAIATSSDLTAFAIGEPNR